MNNTDNKYYVANKYGTIWVGKVSEMDENYSYPHDTQFFATEKEAEDYKEELEN